MLDYPSLAALAAVVREGSFERAAASLGVTPSAVSQRVRGLEERLGAVLVVRGQPCRATDVGTRLCTHVELVRSLEGDVVSELPTLATENDRGGPPVLRVAVNADSLATWFLTAAAYANRIGASLDILRDDEGFTADRLRSGEVMAAVTVDAVPVQGCRTLSLGTMRYVAVANPSFVRRWFVDGVDAERLARAPVICFDRRDDLQTRWAMTVARASLTSAPTLRIPSSHGCVDATMAGLGWGVAPASLVSTALADGRLLEISPGSTLGVPLFWQHARVGARSLAQLTREVVAAARAGLAAPRSA